MHLKTNNESCFVSEKRVVVGKIYRYLENMYFQKNPDIKSFANYVFDIQNKNSESIQEQLRSIVQAYLYLQKKKLKDPKLIGKYLNQILELIKINEKTGTDKLLTYKQVNEQKLKFIGFLTTNSENKLKSKFWKFSYGKELDIGGLKDDTKIGVLSELYLLKDGKSWCILITRIMLISDKRFR